MKNFEKYIDEIASEWETKADCKLCPCTPCSTSGIAHANGCTLAFKRWALSDVDTVSSDTVCEAMAENDKISKQFIDADKTVCFKSLLQRMLDTFIRKNHDYGDSFAESIHENGFVAAFTRMTDKWNRAKTLASMRPDYIKAKGWKCSDDTAAVKDESLVDTLLDQANYNVMTAMELIRLDSQRESKNDKRVE